MQNEKYFALEKQHTGKFKRKVSLIQYDLRSAYNPRDQ